jgi:hypothetical protein
MPVLDGISDRTADVGRRSGEGGNPDHLQARRICVHRPARQCRRIHVTTEPPARLCKAARVVAAGDGPLGSETTRLQIERFLSQPPAEHAGRLG